MADINFTETQLEELIQTALTTGWEIGVAGQPEPAIRLEWIAGRPKVKRRER